MSPRVAPRKPGARKKEDEFLIERHEKLKSRIKGFNVAEEEGEAKARAAGYGIPYIDLTTYPVDQETLVVISEEDAQKARAVLFYKIGAEVSLGLVDPENPNAMALAKKLRTEYHWKIHPYLISQRSLEHLFDIYRVVRLSRHESRGEIGLTEDEIKKISKEVSSMKDLRERFRTASMTDMINIVMAGALLVKASDVHIEPEEKEARLRYRIDGVLQDIATFDRNTLEKTVSRVKLLSGLKINVKNTPQDGRFAINLGDIKIDLRVSLLPSGYGETIVIRLLGVGSVKLKITELGMQERDKELLLHVIKRPNGMVLTTGPTGSGKSTTLYAFMNQIKTPEIKIITLENPIEYRLEGISQTQIDEEAGMTFAKGLRAILRQDPDVIMVGEIRDEETADTAFQAALTGHIVFSTLHTNDSSGAVPRLIDLGLRPYVIAPALNAVIAQRLVRRLCQDCKVSYTPSSAELADMKKQLGSYFPAKLAKMTLYKPKEKGCSKCHETGYRGRIGVYEVFAVDDSIKKMVIDRASAIDIKAAAIRQGMTTMRQDGLLKVITGITDKEEVESAT